MGFLFTQKKERIVAVFDIGSGSITGAIVSIPTDRKGIPTVLDSVQNFEIHRPKNDFDINSLITNMAMALNQTASSLYHKKIGAPDEIYCVLASPWYLSETRVIKLTNEKSFIFNNRLANDLIQKEIAKLKDTYKSKFNSLEGSSEIIEQHTMAVLLNGYVTDDPLSKRCNFLEMDMLISLAPKICLDKIRETLSKTFHHTKISFSSFTVATYLAVRNKYLVQDSYLLLDVRGEITDVGIVTKGILKSVLSFPFGKRTFFEYICTKLEIELRDAKELFKLYSENNLSFELKKKVEPLFKSIENSWGEAFNQCISTLPRTLVLPNVVFLTADNDIKSWFADVLRNEEYIHSSVSDRKPIVITLEGFEFLKMCDVKNGSSDPFLMIEAIAIMRKINN